VFKNLVLRIFCLMKPLVSIIITTKNEEANISRCLDSVKLQDFPLDSIEIIVVDNNSSDRTKEIALSYTSNVYNYGPERFAQRNYGIKQARGKFVLYLVLCQSVLVCVLTKVL